MSRTCTLPALLFAGLLVAGATTDSRAAIGDTFYWSVSLDQLNAQYGWAASTAGDINGDGFSDVVVGAPSYDDGESDEGALFVYLGYAGGLPTSSAQTIESNQTNAYFAISVGAAGDVNGDGYADVIVGTPDYNNGEDGEGHAQVFFGSPGGLLTEPVWSYESNTEAAFLGGSVSTAGDVNGDGYDDVIVGAYGADGYSGEAYVFHGGPGGPSATPSWIGAIDDPDSQYGQSVATAGDVNADGYDDVIVGAPYIDNGQDAEGRVYVYHGGPNGLATTAAWVKESNRSVDLFGYSVQTAGDTNGDGYADVVIGEPAYSNGQSSEGRAVVYLGSATGLLPDPSWTLESNKAAAFFGLSVSTAGDSNGDGFSDVIVGSPSYTNGQTAEGMAFLYLGSPGGLDTASAWTDESNRPDAWFGYSVMTAGDVNGDGFSDVLACAPSFLDGAANGLARIYGGDGAGVSPSARLSSVDTTTGTNFGQAVSAAGDVNGDGFADFIVGVPNYSNGQSGEGGAKIYYSFLDDAATGATLESQQAFASFGTSVACAGDVNGDGYDDVIVGAPLYDNGQDNEGRAFVYHGGLAGIVTTPAWHAEADKISASFGCSVAGAGDVNGDGYGDVIVGAYGYSNGQDSEGRAFVYLGSPSGLLTTPSWTAESNQAVASFGWSVSSAGDVNGDGYSDVIVGANLFDNGQSNEGRAYVYLGSPTGLSASFAWTAESNQALADFGVSVASAGDVNGDGYSDVIVGADAYDNGQVDEGRAFVYHGSASGLAATAAWTAEPNVNFHQFGMAVGGAGDVDGNGFSDVVVGAPWATHDESNEGIVFVYEGSSTGLASAPGTTIESNKSSALFGNSVGASGDTNGDGFSDVIIGSPGYSTTAGTVGGWFVHLGNKNVPGSTRFSYNAGLARLARQARIDGDRPIALLGKSDYQDAFRLVAVGRTAAGRGKVRLEWEVKPRGVPFNGVGQAHGVRFADTGSPFVLEGSITELSEVVGGTHNGTAYHWRSRVVAHSPYFPRTPWLSMARNAMTEIDFRAAGSLLDADPGAGQPVPHVTFLEPVHPQPFTADHALSFSIPEAGEVRLAVYDAQGRERAVLDAGNRAAGPHHVAWDGRDAQGRMLPAGTFFLHLRVGAHAETQKLVWMP